MCVDARYLLALLLMLQVAHAACRQVPQSVDQILTGQASTRLRQFASACIGTTGSAQHKLALGQQCSAPFPGLRATPWWPTEAFGWAAELECGSSVIAEELDAFEQFSEGSDDLWVESVTSLCPDTAGFARLVLHEDGEALARVGCPSPVSGSWAHVLNQRGMFTYSGLTPSQVEALRVRHHIYMPADGRICMAALTQAACSQLAAAMKEVMAIESANTVSTPAPATKRPRC